MPDHEPLKDCQVKAESVGPGNGVFERRVEYEYEYRFTEYEYEHPGGASTP